MKAYLKIELKLFNKSKLSKMMERNKQSNINRNIESFEKDVLSDANIVKQELTEVGKTCLFDAGIDTLDIKTLLAIYKYKYIFIYYFQFEIINFYFRFLTPSLDISTTI